MPAPCDDAKSIFSSCFVIFRCSCIRISANAALSIVSPLRLKHLMVPYFIFLIIYFCFSKKIFFSKCFYFFYLLFLLPFLTSYFLADTAITHNVKHISIRHCTSIGYLNLKALNPAYFINRQQKIQKNIIL